MLAECGGTSEISRTHWRREPDCPDQCLCHAPTRSQVRRLVGEHADRPGYDHAVYVLECRRRSSGSARQLALEALDVKRPPPWTKTAPEYDRLIYVGVSQRVISRIYSHAFGTGAAANFCTIFPPTRILTIQWYPSLAQSYRAEEEMADRLREELADTYVSQPG